MFKRALWMLAIVGLFGSFASAAFIELTPTHSIQWIIDNGGSLRAGDKVFGDWNVVTTGSVGANAPDATEISVTGGYWDGGAYDGEIGLRFNGGWSAGVNQIADSTIAFSVTVDDPMFIIDNTLYMSAFGAANGGMVSISENVYAEAPGPGVDSIADKYVFYDTSTVPATKKQTDHQEFGGAYKKIWITKDVVANGQVSAGGSAHLSEFYQSFSQMPEPGTICLMAFGIAGVAMRRRKK